MASRRNVSRSSGKDVTDAIFEGLLGGIIKSLKRCQDCYLNSAALLL